VRLRPVPVSLARSQVDALEEYSFRVVIVISNVGYVFHVRTNFNFSTVQSPVYWVSFKL